MTDKITIERATEVIDGILDEVEDRFRKENGRFPSLMEEGDYVLLGKMINLRDCYKLGVHDTGYRLMRRFLERGNYFEHLGIQRPLAFNAFIGRVNIGTAPHSEVDFRISAIEKLKETGVNFPEDFPTFLRAVGDIRGIYPTSGPCFLPQTYAIDKGLYKIGYENIGTHLVNPSGNLHMFLKGIGDFDGLSRKIGEVVVGPNFQVYSA